MQTLAEQIAMVLGGLKTAPEGLAETVTYTPASTGVAVDVVGFVGFEEPNTKGSGDSEIERGDGLIRRTSMAFTVLLTDVADPGVDDLLVREDGTEWVATELLHKGHGFARLRFQDVEAKERSRRGYRLQP